MTPYYQDDLVTLYHGDCREVLDRAALFADACVTDPPYGETSARWDVWPAGWVDAVDHFLPDDASLWCFGSARMFLEHRDDFTRWKYGQEALWVKRNGSGPSGRDRLVKVHEWAYHWYRGKWGSLHHEWERVPYFGGDKTALKRDAGKHRNAYQETNLYVDDGTRQPTSVTFVVESPSVRFQKRHQDEKPLAVVMPLVRECTPPGGTVLDVFAGTGTTGVAARMLGRRAVLIEQDEATCEIAAERLSEPTLMDGAAS